MSEFNILSIVLFISQFNFIFCGRLLFLVPITSKSELSIFRPLAVALATKGHHVTFVASVPSTNLSALPPTWTEVIPTSTQITDESFTDGDLLDKRRFFKNKLRFVYNLDFSFADEICHSVYQNIEFERHVLNGEFDVCITSAFAHYCFEGIFWKKSLPFIYYSSLHVPQWSSRMAGFHQPLSYIPNPMLEYTDEMSFSERVVNGLSTWWINGMLDWSAFPKAETIYRKYLGQDIPGLDVIQRKVSLIFSNSHYALTLPRPLPPDIIEIGGLHCRPAEKLPKDLNDFVSGGKEGFIYFSFGTLSLGNTMPEHVRQVFVNVFTKLKQRVIWKYETETMSDLPMNVKLGKWLPQQDILGHPNIKLFITHGGLLSIQEATFHGVPLIGLPIGFDQDMNMRLAQKSGFAIKLEIVEITEEKLETAIREILTDARYSENSRRVSSIIQDEPQKPMDKAIYWIEHVMKYKGAPYIRSASRDLNFIQFHYLDVFAALLSIPFLLSTLLIILTINYFFKKKSTSNSPLKKNQ